MMGKPFKVVLQFFDHRRNFRMYCAGIVIGVKLPNYSRRAGEDFFNDTGLKRSFVQPEAVSSLPILKAASAR
jgi:hypothetical protein